MRSAAAGNLVIFVTSELLAFVFFNQRGTITPSRKASNLIMIARHCRSDRTYDQQHENLATERPIGRLLLHIVVLLAVALSLGACRSQTTFNDDDAQDYGSISDPKARRLLSAGDIEAAADRYSSLAARERDPYTQQEYQIIAGEILFDRGRLEAGAEKLAVIPETLIAVELQQRRQILVAKQALYNSDAEGALTALPLPEDVESALHRARVYEVRAQSYRSLQQPDEELAARIGLEEQLSNPDIVDKNHVQIWQLLTTQSISTLREMTTNVRNDTYQGWIELALAHTSSGTDSQLRGDKLQSWQQRFPDHPARERFVSSLFNPAKFGGFSIAESSVNQIAVLLPMSAPGIGSAAAAIRDGIIIAYQNSADSVNRPGVRFYDTGENTNFVRGVYQRAVSDGADVIIGPLRKDAVAAIITQRNIPVPTLTLNYVDSFTSGVTQNVIQFGLAPEDEARAAAVRAIALGYRHAVVLQSDDSRGDRESRAFQEEMLFNGGEVVHTAVLPADEYDYSTQIKDALLITQSDNRFRSVSAAIGEKLFFEPSIRDDLDVVFLAISSEQAQSVRPQLSFFRAANVPKFGTSRIRSTEDDSRANNDLNTIAFTDAPWVLDPVLKNDKQYQQVFNLFPESAEIFSTLYALGLDAYYLATNLGSLKQTQANRIKGYTGDLSLEENGKIQRHLLWAEYIDGEPNMLPPVELNSPVLDN